MKKSTKIVFVTEKNGQGCFDCLEIDLYNRCYVYNCEAKNSNCDGAITLNRPDFDKIYDVAESLLCGETVYGDSDCENEEEDNKPIIDSAALVNAVNCRLDKKQLDAIISFDYRYQQGDYYDYNAIINNIHNFMEGGQEVSYFTSWLVLLMRCMRSSSKANENLADIYGELEKLFDDASFMGDDKPEKQRRKECLRLLAHIRWLNHKIEDVKSGHSTDFETGGVITYVAFAFSLNGGKQGLNRVCVVDKNSGRINYMYVKEFDFLEDINYSFLSDARFDDLCGIYFYDYKLDTSLSPALAAKSK